MVRLDQRPKVGEGGAMQISGGRVLQAEGTAGSKALRQDHEAGWRNSKEWPEWNE